MADSEGSTSPLARRLGNRSGKCCFETEQYGTAFVFLRRDYRRKLRFPLIIEAFDTSDEMIRIDPAR